MLVPRKFARALALSLTLCLLTLPGLGNGSEKKAKAAASPAVPQFAGKLVTRGNQPVLVNGYIVGTGTTILTGATIQTFNGTKASVRLGTLGDFELSPNSTATLAFGGDQVTGMLKRGCATLTTNASVAGVLSTPDGMLTKTDHTKLSSVNVCVPGSEDTATVPDPTPDLNNAVPQRNRGGLGGISPWGLLGAASYAVGVGTAKATRTSTYDNLCCCCCCCNPSPSRP